MVLEYDSHQGMLAYVKELNHTYRMTPSLWERDREPESFGWIDVNNAEQSVISYVRYGNDSHSIAIINFSARDYSDYRVGVPEPVAYSTRLNSNAGKFGGTDAAINDCHDTDEIAWHGRNQSIKIHLPPYTFMLLTPLPGDTL
jgi:1,4-alpha-glucan branching enzyme